MLTKKAVFITKVICICFKLAYGTKVLIFGGNGMLGSETVVQFLENGVDCTIVNRGNWYWDAEERVKPYVKHIVCDRADNITETCPALVNAEEVYDAIVDFSSYYPEDLEAVLNALKGKIRRYIYISTDSVYEVCLHNQHGGFNRESDAVRPSNAVERHILAERDSYGDRKLACEEILQNRYFTDGFEYMGLRLSDVFGPRDNTRRWLSQFLLLYAADYMSFPIRVEKSAFFSQLSLVYSKDVATLIAQVIHVEGKVYNKVYNLAYSDTPTLEELLLEMARTMGLANVSITEDEKSVIYLGIPSTTRGPISVLKAVKELQWNTTSMDVAFAETYEFYEKAVLDPRFTKELQGSVRKLGMEVGSFLKMWKSSSKHRNFSGVKTEL